MELANAYIKSGAIPLKYRDDARHIAIGVYHDIDFIVSWNYKHMVNIHVERLINSVNLKMGYGSIEIISPEEVIDYGRNGSINLLSGFYKIREEDYKKTKTCLPRAC